MPDLKSTGAEVTMFVAALVEKMIDSILFLA